MKLKVSKSSPFVRFEKLVKSLQDQVQHLMSLSVIQIASLMASYDAYQAQRQQFENYFILVEDGDEVTVQDVSTIKQTVADKKKVIKFKGLFWRLYVFEYVCFFVLFFLLFFR